MNEHEQKYGIILAGLLFDIGKFVWMENPQSEKNFLQLSKEFFEQHIKDKTCIKPVSNFIDELLSEKNEIFPHIRDVFRESEKLNDSASNDVFPLRPIFPSIRLNDEKNKDYPQNYYYYKPATLNKDNVFPIKTEKASLDENEKNEYIASLKTLYENFTNEIANIPDYEISSFVDSLLYLYEKYLVYINSSLTDSSSDVSLFDHTKTVAALSVCKAYAENPDNAFLIVASDVSGIQQFIYGETEKASKKLRGRSFYVGLLTELFTDYLLQKFDLPRTNVLMNGGGHFVMIVPNNEKNKEILKNASNEIQRWLFETFKGDINLPVYSIEANDELYKNFQEWYNLITSGLVEAKRKKGFQNLKGIFQYELDKMDIYEYTETMNEDQSKEVNKETTEYEKNMKILSALFENLGKVLPKTKYIVRILSNENNIEILSEINRNKKYNNKSDQLFLFLKRFSVGYLFTKDVAKFLSENRDSNFKHVLIQKLNETDIYDNEINSIKDVIHSLKFPVSFGFTFQGNYAPTEGDNVITFEKLAVMNNEQGEKELSYPLLATLRMDVDNLGTIFSQGLLREKDSLRTLSRTVGLSRGFNLFFGGYLNNIAEKWGVYITYSGGDDLFVVASWINATNFAVQVKKDYQKFVCDNPQVTISGGLYYHKEHYPIGRAAQFAGEAEEEAKNLSENNEKDAISSFGKPLKWEDFLEYYDYGKRLDKIVDRSDKNDESTKAEKIKSAYLHFLLQRSKEIYDLDLTEREKKKYGAKKIEEMKLNNYHRIISKIKYYLAKNPRNITAAEVEKVNKNPDAVNSKVFLLSKIIFEPKYLENLVIPASYVILKNRDIKKK